MSSKYTKRKLDFQNKALHGQTFYIDIKAETLRRKITRRIKDLGGCIEGFLSKDIDLVVTDKNQSELKKSQSAKSVETANLSRGNIQNLYIYILTLQIFSLSSPQVFEQINLPTWLTNV